MSPPEACRRALLELGGIEPAKELHRDSRGFPWLDGVLQDVRCAVRGLRRSPGFTVTAVATLAVAIGINAGVFTIAGTVLFGGYPQVDPDNRILYASVGPISNPEFQDWQAQAKSFSGIAGVADGGLRLVLQDDSGNSETCDTTQLSTNAFQVLGQKPIIGRDFAPSDGVRGAPSVELAPQPARSRDRFL
jgi:macrolide transport system ATP-binding/permease protein